MKTVIAYYLLVFYAAAAFKPVLPIVADFFAHSLAHDRHVTTVHHSHGGNHVHYEISKAAGESQQENQSTDGKSSEPVSIHTFSSPSDGFTPDPIRKTIYGHLKQQPAAPSLPLASPPPKAFTSLS